MQEMLIGSPAGAFAFGIDASQFEDTAVSPGPSHAARPPAELRRGALRWHPAGHQQGQVLRASRFAHPVSGVCGERVSPASFAVSPARSIARVFYTCPG